MKRRTLLATAGAAVSGIALMPSWIRHAFAQDAPSPARAAAPDEPAPWPPTPNPPAEVHAAYRRARRAGKALLVLVVPPDNQQWQRGHLWGEVLQLGDDPTLACLALVETVCAEMSAVRALVPSMGEGAPLAVLVETDAVPARSTVIDCEVPDWTHSVYDVLDELDHGRTNLDVVIDQRVAAVSDVLREAIAPSVDRIAERAAQNARRIPASDRDRIVESLRTGSALAPALVDRGAAVVMLAAARADRVEDRRTLQGQLAGAARQRLVTAPPVGAAARWAHDSPCGMDEPELTLADQAEQRRRALLQREREARARREGRLITDRLIFRGGWACGMGFVPDRSARFLRFYARPDVEAHVRLRLDDD